MQSIYHLGKTSTTRAALIYWCSKPIICVKNDTRVLLRCLCERCLFGPPENVSFVMHLPSRSNSIQWVTHTHLIPASSSPQRSWSGTRCSGGRCCRCRRPCWLCDAARRGPRLWTHTGSPPPWRRSPIWGSKRWTTLAAACEGTLAEGQDEDTTRFNRHAGEHIQAYIRGTSSNTAVIAIYVTYSISKAQRFRFFF